MPARVMAPPRTRLPPPGYAKQGRPRVSRRDDISETGGGAGAVSTSGGNGFYQLPHGSSAVTAMTANNRVRYAIDKWNRRMGAGLALGCAAPAHAPSVTFRLSAGTLAADGPPSPPVRVT